MGDLHRQGKVGDDQQNAPLNRLQMRKRRSMMEMGILTKGDDRLEVVALGKTSAISILL
jgi:inner membrane protein involved in colicin E2 resistance